MLIEKQYKNTYKNTHTHSIKLQYIMLQSHKIHNLINQNQPQKMKPD